MFLSIKSIFIVAYNQIFRECKACFNYIGLSKSESCGGTNRADGKLACV